MSDVEESKQEIAGEAPAEPESSPPVQAPQAGSKPLTTEEKRKIWTRRIVGLIVLFAVLGSVTLLFAVQMVTNMFKMILSP